MSIYGLIRGIKEQSNYINKFEAYTSDVESYNKIGVALQHIRDLQSNLIESGVDLQPVSALQRGKEIQNGIISECSNKYKIALKCLDDKIQSNKPFDIHGVLDEVKRLEGAVKLLIPNYQEKDLSAMESKYFLHVFLPHFFEQLNSIEGFDNDKIYRKLENDLNRFNLQDLALEHQTQAYSTLKIMRAQDYLQQLHLPAVMGKKDIEAQIGALKSQIASSPEAPAKAAMIGLGLHLHHMIQALGSLDAIKMEPKTVKFYAKYALEGAPVNGKKIAAGCAAEVHTTAFQDEQFAKKIYHEKIAPKVILKEERIKLIAGGHPNVAYSIAIDPRGKTTLAPLAISSLFEEIVAAKHVSREAPALKFAKQMLQGLGYLHAQGIIHRDIKPENILVFPEDHYVITDFDLADEDGPGKNHQVKGSPLYLSPEGWVQGTDIDYSIDLFALGITLYTFLMGGHEYNDGKPTRESYIKAFSAIDGSKISPFIRDLVNPKLARNPDSKTLQLIQALCMPNPKDRPSAAEALDMIDPLPTREHNEKGYEKFTKADHEEYKELTKHLKAKIGTADPRPAGGAGAPTKPKKKKKLPPMEEMLKHAGT